jgi:DNA-binding Lrp family transcriptional regulator
MTKAYVAIHCHTGKENQVIRALMEIKGISEVTGVLGLYDVIVTIEAEDSMKLEQIITKQVRNVPHVLTTMTLIVV